MNEQKKRIRFITASTVNTMLWLVVTKFVAFEWKYAGLVLLSLFVVVSTVWALDLEGAKLRQNKSTISLVILPVAFLVGWSMFVYLFDNWWIGVVAMFVYWLINYLILLTHNLFLVTAFYKAIPLYRSAVTVNFLLVLLTAFLLFDAVGSFYLAFWIVGLLVAGISFALFTYLGWVVAVVEPQLEKKVIVMHSSVMAVVLAEIEVVLSWWPVGVFLGSVYLMALFYIVGSLLQYEWRGRLFHRAWIETIWVAVGIFFGLFAATSWRGI